MAQSTQSSAPTGHPVLTPSSLEMRRRLPAPPAEVFRAWTQPEIIQLWFCPVGGSVVTSEVDLRPGGRYRVGMKTPDGKVHTTTGVYQEIQPPERLVMTWKWEDPDALETLVTVEFRAIGNDTELVLRHDRFADAKRRDGHLGGWEGCLGNLVQYFAKRER